MGNIYHDALEHFSRRVEKSEYTWFNIPEDVQETFIEESMNDAIAGCKNAGAFENVRNRYLTGRMRQTIKRTVWALTTQIQKGKFVPSDFEVSFSRADKLDAIRFQLSDEEKMNLLGGMASVTIVKDADGTHVSEYDLQPTVNVILRNANTGWYTYRPMLLDSYSSDLAAQNRFSECTVDAMWALYEDITG